MRKNLCAVLLCFSAILSFNVNSNAQGTLIHYWNFNSFTSVITLPATADLSADYTRISSPTAALLYVPQPGTSSAFSDYCDDVAGDATDTVNDRLGAPEGNAFRARNPSDSMEILLYMPTTNYTNLQIKYGCELSSYTSGDSVNVFAYSVDSGATWITSGSGLSEWVDSGALGFKLISIHVNDPLASDNRKFVFKITTAGRNSSTSGNNRYDNITLDGDTANIAEGIKPITLAPSYTLYPNPVMNTLNIKANLDGDKTIIVCDAIGQKISEENVNGSLVSMSTANLSAGMYFISIRENTTGNLTTMKFTRQ